MHKLRHPKNLLQLANNTKDNRAGEKPYRLSKTSPSPGLSSRPRRSERPARRYGNPATETGARAPGRETLGKPYYTSKALPFSSIL